MRTRLTDHCITRYHERVRPTLLRRQAMDELKALVESGTGEWSDTPPEWLFDRELEVDGYLTLADGIALVVVKGVAVTCVIRGCTNETVRKRKNERKRKRREIRKQKVKDASMGKLQGRKKARMIATGAYKEGK